MTKQTVRDVAWQDKRALVRVDFNVPFQRGTLRVSDDSRIRGALPTINYLRRHGASIVLCTHLGRPAGKRVSDLDLAPIAERLAGLIGAPVTYVHDIVGAEAQAKAKALKPGEVLLLDNVRFDPNEEANDPAFAKALSALGDVYVNDAFGTAHRAHASTEGVAHYLPAVAGLLMEKEVNFLSGVFGQPERPFAAVLGGAKVSDKLVVLRRLMGHADAILIGGGMAATFLKAQGFNVGASLVEDSLVPACATMLKDAEDGDTELSLPVDVVVAPRIEKGVGYQVVPINRIEDGQMVLDIGPDTIIRFTGSFAIMKTIVWNGPMGVFEVPPFDEGTRAVAEALAASPATTIVGGGSTAEAVEHLGLSSRMNHVSTGGGASLEFLEGKVLPGVTVLHDREAPAKRERARG